MKKFNRLIALFCALSIMMSCFTTASAVKFLADESESESASIALIHQYADAINNHDVEGYIALFTQDNQSEMREYLEDFGDKDFFQEAKVDVTNYHRLSDEVGQDSTSITDLDTNGYSDTSIYYTEMVIEPKNNHIRTLDNLQENGYAYKNFIIVNEEGSWKILRISAPDLNTIIDAGEGFNTDSEQTKMESQLERTQFQMLDTLANRQAMDAPNLIAEGYVFAAAPSADPTSITVYLTKSANKNYYGTSSKTLDWTTYLKNVIPVEWIVSYYGQYPAYLQAGAFASKMYAWWQILHPKYDYAPYYAALKDDSNDQNFLYNAYSSLDTSTYKGYVDDVISYVRNTAMCKDNGEMFEIHYHATKGTEHSGQMSASGALSLAKDGSSCYQILSYYYNYSSYTGTDHKISLYAWA